jgi:hypothetical protein
MLELAIDDADIGDELVLPEPGSVQIAGVVRFDPARDDVRRLAIVRGGEVIASTDARSAPGEMRVEVRWPVEEAAWFALRADGDKVGEAPPEDTGLHDAPAWVRTLVRRFSSGVGFDEREADMRARTLRRSAAHTGAIYVRIAGRPGIEASARARQRARSALERLDAIEARFDEERIDDLLLWPFVFSDGIPADQLRADRPAVLREIEQARNHYRAIAR